MTTQRNKVSKRKSSANFTHENLKMMRFNEEMSYNFEEVFDRIRIEGDGNCLFRAIRYCLKGTEKNHELLRKKVCQHLKDNENEYKTLYQPRKGVNSFKKYLELLNKDGTWGDHLEISVLAELYNFNVIIYKPNSLEVHSEHIGEDSFDSTPLFHLEFENYNHYNVFKLKQTSKAKAYISHIAKKKKTKDSTSQNENANKKILVTLSRQEKKLKDEKKDNAIENKKEISSQIFSVSKKKVVLKNKQKNSEKEDPLYPLAKGGYNTYNEVYQYLKNKTLPTRIKNPKSLRNWKKEVEDRYFLTKRAKNVLSQSRLEIKLKGNTSKTIPFKNEIKSLIEVAHNGFSQSIVKHNGIRMTLRNLGGPVMQFYWASMSADVKEHAENCIECVQDQPIKQIKVYKPIIPAKPFDRFTADLYKIPDEMIEASGTKYRYILSCVDHFSKYKWTELIQNKEALTISHKLDLIFNSFQPPVHFQTDNGKEFKNFEVNELCRRKNIKHVHGKPYYPQSQGVVEKLNDLIARSLKTSLSRFKKDESKTIWDIEDSLKAWTINSNKNIHSVTKLMPYVAITLTDAKQIQKVQENIKNYYQTRQNNKKTTEFTLKVGTKVFIIKQVRKVQGKNKLIAANNPNKIKSKKDKNKIRVPAQVTNISQLDYCLVDIQIYGRIDTELDLTRSYSISVDNLEIPKSMKSWELLAKRDFD